MLTEDYIPPYAPIMDFNYSLTVTEHKKFVGFYLVQGSTVPKAKNNNRKNNTYTHEFGFGKRTWRKK